MGLGRSLALPVALVGISAAACAHAADEFTPLFNGRDLAGWVPVNVASNTFTVRDGIIVSTGKPTGIMRTDRMYENFVLELEWKHVHPKGNAGLFIWSEPMTAPGTPFAKSIEVQVLDPAAGNPEGIATGHGDIFAIHGARMTPDRPHPRGWERCLPSEHRVKPAGEWNHYRVEAIDGRVTLAVNGKVVSGASNSSVRKGYLCLESEGSECHFRNLRIRELPSSNPPTEAIASEAREWRLLYNGLDLTGWSAVEPEAGNWQSTDWVLKSNSSDGGSIRTTEEFERIELQFDWRVAAHDAELAILLRGESGQRWPLRARASAAGPNGWNRTTLYLAPRGLRIVHNLDARDTYTATMRDDFPRRGPIGFEVRGGTAEFANIFVGDAE
jgi:hypothetical protein